MSTKRKPARTEQQPALVLPDRPLAPLAQSRTVQGLFAGVARRQEPPAGDDSFPIWTDPRSDGSVDNRPSRGSAPVPLGLSGSVCGHCGSSSLIGALITETADERDPNLLCLNCHYWRD